MIKHEDLIEIDVPEASDYYSEYEVYIKFTDFILPCDSTLFLFLKQDGALPIIFWVNEEDKENEEPC